MSLPIMHWMAELIHRFRVKPQHREASNIDSVKFWHNCKCVNVFRKWMLGIKRGNMCEFNMGLLSILSCAYCLMLGFSGREDAIRLLLVLYDQSVCQDL